MSLLSTIIAQLCIFLILGYNDTGEYWRSVYEAPTFQSDLENLLNELRPLYSLLHAYVRKQLIKQYGQENFPRSGHIPAHLLGKCGQEQDKSRCMDNTLWGSHSAVFILRCHLFPSFDNP